MTPVSFSIIPLVLSLASAGAGDTTSTSSVAPSEPTPSGTIFFDTRTGGAQDLNKFNDWTTAQRIFDSGFRGPVTLDPNFDGRGKHAIRFDWKQAGVVDPEQDAAVEKRVQASGRILVSWKVWLGRTPSGGGNGSVGNYQLVTAHSNAHTKRMLWLRSDANASRIYLVWRPGEAKFSIDGKNWNSNPLSIDPLTITGREQKWTVEVIASSSDVAQDGVLRVWLNGTQVLNQTNCLLGSASFTSMQWPATMLVPAANMSEYWYDIVFWKP